MQKICAVRFDNRDIYFFQFDFENNQIMSQLREGIGLYSELNPKPKCQCDNNNKEIVEGNVKLKGEYYHFKTKACLKCKAVDFDKEKLEKGEVSWVEEQYVVLQNYILKKDIRTILHKLIELNKEGDLWKENIEDIIGLFKRPENLPESEKIKKINTKGKISLENDNEYFLKLNNIKGNKVCLRKTKKEKESLDLLKLYKLISNNPHLIYYSAGNDKELVYSGGNLNLLFQKTK